MWLSLVGAVASAACGRYSEQQAGAAVEICRAIARGANSGHRKRKLRSSAVGNKSPLLACKNKISRCGSVWESAAFGTQRPQVRILSSRPRKSLPLLWKAFSYSKLRVVICDSRPERSEGRGERLRARPADETASKKLCAAVEICRAIARGANFGHRKRPPQVEESAETQR